MNKVCPNAGEFYPNFPLLCHLCGEQFVFSGSDPLGHVWSQHPTPALPWWRRISNWLRKRGVNAQ